MIGWSYDNLSVVIWLEKNLDISGQLNKIKTFS